MKTIALLLLLIAASQVQGQVRKPPIGTLAYDSMAWAYSFIPSSKAQVYVYTGDKWEGIKSDSCEAYKLEIQTLRLLNDSLTKKIKEMNEYMDYSCGIIEKFTAIKTINGYRLLFNRKQVLKAVIRYQKRYKNEGQ